ncbi:MAG: cytochrome c oxidase assembly protein [Gemmatimonadales bacterium]|nr:MAG: cytochrome c oxidase assembly protein [Gemmatimonadales bacterium]
MIAILLSVYATAYLCAALRERGRRGWGWLRIASTLAGAGVGVVALAPPLAAWAVHDLRGHMVQHLLLGMFAPLGLVLGAPGTLLLRTLNVGAARRVTKILRSRVVGVITHPATAVTVDVGALYLLFLTPLYAALHTRHALHDFVLLHFLLAGSLLAWAILRPDPSPHRPTFAVRTGALIVAIAAHSSLAKIMYAYGWPRGTHHSLEEIRAAAQIMYYGGDAAELLLAIALFAGWYRARGRAARRSRAGGQPMASGIPGAPLRVRA